ncbi:hypothetical protein Q73A0000_01485 [Kaistella flava (ex Peng et al. 2021)]|uniref:DUF6438 domain-containing protein n=1 Tax=Kaistella flava (ex Peng et al. 2021) TaxID=2038776 RepID=A0A7M2Y618_9FLAO|nr:hypothetical protein [Kaistella flava (ex Peng et al. 2021)]QOW09114.1 hypothetical protein Q73A0000_01485 [Kaistella flava (ex Peng et al. 2021)]
MKYIFLFVSLFLILSCDKKDLTDKEVLEIIHADKNYEDLQLKTDFLTGENFIDSIKSFRKIIAKENLKPIFKADLNGDGKQDYLVNLEYKKDSTNENLVRFIDDDAKNCVVLLSSSNGYKILSAGKKRVYDIFSAKIINYNGQNLIKVLNFIPRFDDLNNILKFDTLMVTNNQLTEFANKRSNNNISEIKFTQYGGYAPGVYFTLSFKKDSIILNSKFYKKLKGNFVGNKNQDFQNLGLYLNNIDFKNLEERYSIGCCDHSAIETKVVYDNGKIKTIYDYGEKGSLGLLKFYDSIHAIMEKQKWQKIE